MSAYHNTDPSDPGKLPRSACINRLQFAQRGGNECGFEESWGAEMQVSSQVSNAGLQDSTLCSCLRSIGDI